MKVVIASGGFDPIHEGHISYLKQAAAMGDKLIVALNSDAWLTAKKGKPFMNWKNRESIIENLRFVDRVIGFPDYDNTACAAIQECLNEYPEDDILFVNGGDRVNHENIPEQEIFEDNPRVHFVDSVGGNEKKNSSSELLDNWANNFSSEQWGFYRTLDTKHNIKIKEIILMPNKGTRLRKHSYRSEHWYILSGSCQLYTEYNGESESVILQQHSTFLVDREVWYKVTNIDILPCNILEIQYGEKCSDDDIIRKNDK